MIGRRERLAREETLERNSHRLRLLALLAVVSGIAACAGAFENHGSAWKQLLGFAWFVVFTIELVRELRPQAAGKRVGQARGTRPHAT